MGRHCLSEKALIGLLGREKGTGLVQTEGGVAPGFRRGRKGLPEVGSGFWGWKSSAWNVGDSRVIVGSAEELLGGMEKSVVTVRAMTMGHKAHRAKLGAPHLPAYGCELEVGIF